MEFKSKQTKENNVNSLAISHELYHRLLKYTKDNKLETSYYNHGHGVDRQYTLEYCLQTTTKETDVKYYLKRGGRTPSKFSSQKKDLNTLKAETPDFDTLHKNITRKYPQHVKFVNK